MNNKISGVLIFLSFIFTNIAYFFDENLLIIGGVFLWISMILMFGSLKNKLLPIILLVMSILIFLYSFYNNFEIYYYKIFTINQYLLQLLIGVGFLRLIAKPKLENINELPKGKNSFIKTYLGVHLFGSVINLSSLILVADKMYKKAKLSSIQVMVLTRAFASDAYWSPFFVAFAAAITYAPNLDTKLVILNGLILAFFSFILTYFDTLNTKKYNLDEFRGYPIAFETLFLPIILAFLVLFTNHYYPEIKIIVLIALFSFLLVLIILPLKKGVTNFKNELIDHVLNELPKMKGELSLFLIAGMFGVLVSSVLIGYEIKLPIESFDWKIAGIILAIFIILGFIGIHPIISISIIGDLLGNFNHTLLAIMFLIAWSTTVSTSPFSGLNLTIVSRYNFSSLKIFKINIFYALKIYLISLLSLYFISKYLNL